MSTRRSSSGPWEPSAAGTNAAKAAEASAAAWQLLALAGAPRTTKSEREKFITRARDLHDQVRAAVTNARSAYSYLTKRVNAQIESSQKRPPAERHSWSDCPTPADKAAVTRLSSVISEITATAVQLGRCLHRYHPSVGRTYSSAEWDRALQVRGYLDVTDGFQACAWCAKLEERHRELLPLDEAGFACRREHGRRFICTVCFIAGADLVEPAPRPRPVVPPAPPAAEAHPADCICPEHRTSTKVAP